MRYFALATDYDGTIAHDGGVDDKTLDALKRLRESGRKLILVTGRELDELLGTFPQIDLFDRVVAENGAVIYEPATKEIRLLGKAPSEEFVAELKRCKVYPVAVGRVIVASWEPHQDQMLEAIRSLGLDLQLIFNKGAVMVLPTGINKATGLKEALTEMGLSLHNVVGIGDAENDHAFLRACRCGVAVSNALDSLKDRVDFVTKGARGEGVTQVIDQIIADDLKEIDERLQRHRILVGKNEKGDEVFFDPHRQASMICGTSGSGKSTLTTGLLERLVAEGHQFVILDPEGDYTALEFAVTLGSPQRAPLIEEVLDLLKEPSRNAVVNMLGIAVEHRPEFFTSIFPRLQELRSRTGRPHFMVVDEAHHMIPSESELATSILTNELAGLLFITVHPGSISPTALKTVNTVMIVGQDPAQTMKEFCEAAKESIPSLDTKEPLPTGDVLLWSRGEKRAELVHSEPPKSERKRHSRKYAEGNLGADRSFYFRGKKQKLNLKAQNLIMFLQMADGVDDETWNFHLKEGDYSKWLNDSVKDNDLAEEVAVIEKKKIKPEASRAEIRQAIEARYTLPADQASGKI